jgi:hypothetical protein
MLKKILLMIILLNLHNHIFSDGIFDSFFFKWPIIGGFGSVGTSIQLQKDNNVTFDFASNFLFFGLMHDKFGIETSLINYQYSNIYGHCVSLLTPRIFFHIYHWPLWSDNRHNSEVLVLRLYASINYLNIYNFSQIDLKNTIFSISFRLIDLDFIMFYPSETFSIEIGYKNINGKHNFYSAIKIDPFTFFILTFGKIKNREYNSERHNGT